MTLRGHLVFDNAYCIRKTCPQMPIWTYWTYKTYVDFGCFESSVFDLPCQHCLVNWEVYWSIFVFLSQQLETSSLPHPTWRRCSRTGPLWMTTDHPPWDFLRWMNHMQCTCCCSPRNLTGNINNYISVMEFVGVLDWQIYHSTHMSGIKWEPSASE